MSQKDKVKCSLNALAKKIDDIDDSAFIIRDTVKYVLN